MLWFQPGGSLCLACTGWGFLRRYLKDVIPLAFSGLFPEGIFPFLQSTRNSLILVLRCWSNQKSPWLPQSRSRDGKYPLPVPVPSLLLTTTSARPAGATAEPPSPAPDPRVDQPAENGTQTVPGDLAGKAQGSLSLCRYLSNPAAYEMRALGLPASKSPLVTSEPGSHKAASTSANKSAVAIPGPVPKSGDPSPLPLASVAEGAIEADTSISLSPSPPACPSPGEDGEKHHDLMGLGAAHTAHIKYVSTHPTPVNSPSTTLMLISVALLRIMNKKVKNGRINRSTRKRKAKKSDKKP